MTSQSLCSREDSFLATGTGWTETERGRQTETERGQASPRLASPRLTRFRSRNQARRQAYHVQEVDGSFEGTAGPGAGGVLAFLQHPPPVARAVLLALGPCCRGLRNHRREDN